MNTINHQENTLSEQQKKRFIESERAFQQGVALLDQAHAQAFQDKQLLVQAFDAFAKAFQLNHQHADACASLAYLFLITQNLEKAQNYLKEAIRIAPQNERALFVQEALINFHKPQTENQDFLLQISLLNNEADPDSETAYDQLYDRVEQFITDQTRKFLQRPVPMRASVDSKTLNAQRELFKELKLFHSVINEKIGLIAQDLDTAELIEHLSPLSQLTERLTKVLRQGLLLKQHKIEIESSYEICLALFRRIKHQDLSQSAQFNARFFADLNKLFDRCDLLADKLDRLSEADLQEILPAYNKLLQYVQNLQENLDDFI